MTGVEAAVVSTVVSGTLKIVSNKLAPLLIKEYSCIVGVKEDLQELHDLAEEINIWLETTSGNYIGSRQSFAWLKKLKDISYDVDDVDDVVDEFQLKSERHASDGDGGIMSRYMCTKPISFVFQCKAANKINAIKKRFAAIVKQRTDYLAITNSLSVDPNVRHANMRTTELLSLSNVDEESVVGRDKDKQKIISMLEENDDEQKIKVVSIIGLGGSGKTTLAKLVFNDGNIIEKHFEVRLWLHVSQEFDVKDLIKKLFEAFSDNNPGPHALPYMTKTILDKLTGKRFLLILDDVWTDSRDVWEEFMVYIKVGGPKSRILLTTRNREVAVIVGSTHQFHLPFLSPEDCWQVFQQSLVTLPTGWNFEFEEVGKAIVDKCGGVPLAVKVLAGALHGKEQIEEWQAMRDKNLSHSNVNGKEDRVAECLRLSYMHLPSNLKQCFTICSIFPKGHKIDKEQLIDLWIAHDMITVEDPFDYLNLEYVGNKNFDSLLEVSFLQNVEEKDGRLTCEMHDLVHDMAMSIIGDEISLDMTNEATSATKSYRYFCLIKQPENLAPKSIFRKTRAVYMHWYGDYTYVMAMKHAKHLRSVMVGCVGAKEAKIISQVKHLKYLALSVENCEMLPEAISDVWSLQALHVTHSYSILELPKSIGNLKMLRTLNLSYCINLKNLPESIGDCQMISSIDLFNCSGLTVLPDSIGKLQKLIALNLSFCQGLKCLPDSICKLQKLRTLNLSFCQELKGLPDSIGKLEKLRTLTLSFCQELKCIPDSIGGCQMISSIDLCSCMMLTGLPNSIGRNEMLRVLRLGQIRVKRLPSSITKLRNLVCLDLQGCCELVELPEGIDNLVKLQVLNLKGCKKLGGMPLGIGQLSLLQNLGLFVVGKGEKFAGIFELANVSRIGEELRISGISHVLDPNDAHMACLKQKTNLQRLNLNWMVNEATELITKLKWMANGIEEENTKLEQDVLDGLQPPYRIKELEIHMYSGTQYAWWMQNQVGSGAQGPTPFPFLRVMRLYDFPKLKNLHGLVELPCLEELELYQMPSLESITGGPFPSLLKLNLHELPCLGEVWMVAESTMPDGQEVGGCFNCTPQLGQVRIGNCLTKLVITDCPNLEVKPHLPLSLQHLQVSSSEQLLQLPSQCQWLPSSTGFSHMKKLQLCNVTGLGSGHGWELLQHMTALESLEIKFSYELIELPESLWGLRSLLSLEVSPCSGIHMLPESIGELQCLQELTIKYCYSLSSLPRSMGHLTSLQMLEIGWCDALHQLPDCLEELCSLYKLEIKYLQGLTSLPHSICCLTTSLQILRICNCPGIKSLPEGMKDLIALQILSIDGCLDLQRRCERGKGEDWHLISHIPDLHIGDPEWPKCTA